MASTPPTRDDNDSEAAEAVRYLVPDEASSANVDLARHGPLSTENAADDDNDTTTTPTTTLESTTVGITATTATAETGVEHVEQVTLADARGRVGVYTGNIEVRSRWPHGPDGIMVYTTHDTPTPSNNTNTNNNYSNDHTAIKYHGAWRHGHWHGECRVWWRSGDVYEGQCAEASVRHGRGVQRWSDGRVYDGDWVHDHRHGHGTYQWPTHGDTHRVEYVGDLVRNVRHGQGRYVDERVGIEYEGAWQNGTYHGYGTYRWNVDTNGRVERSDGSTRTLSSSLTSTPADTVTHVYRGNFEAGQPHGHGIEVQGAEGVVVHEGLWNRGQPVRATTTSLSSEDVHAKGNTPTHKDDTLHHTLVVRDQKWNDPQSGQSVLYRGLWSALQQHPVGHGTADYQPIVDNDPSRIGRNHHEANAQLVCYEGCFNDNGQFHGHGRLSFASGDVYEGEFSDGTRQGSGTYTWKDGRSYTGHFEQNARAGTGTMSFPNGDYYEGAFVQGKRQGYGRFLFADGALYEGSWHEGLYSGPQGTLVHSDGRVYTGAFVAGVPHGPGKELAPDGKVTYEGEWIRGKPAAEAQALESRRQARMAAERQRKYQPAPESAVAEAAKVPSALPRTQPFALSSSTSSPSNGQPIGTSTPLVVISPEPAPDEAKAASSVDTARRAVQRVMKELEAPPCEAVVDIPILDRQGNLGRYTGLVLKESRRPHGVGRLVYGDGKRIHEGFWHEGSKEGHGRCLFFPQGDFHEGEYKNNVRHGPGSYIWKDGRTYVGHYKDDLRDGEGVFCYPSGEKYEGSFFRGQRNGFGVFTFDAGQYKGEWLSGKYHGKGKLDWDPGMSYEGEFQGGLFKGAGTLKDSTGKILQQGDWVEGELITSLANGNEEKEGRSQKEMSDADCGPADATPLEQAPVLDTHANPDPLSPVNQAPKAIETVTSHTLNKRVGEITFSDVLIVD